MVNNPPATAGDIIDEGLIPGLGRSSGGGNGHSSILAWRITRTEEPARLQSVRSQRVRRDLALNRHKCAPGILAGS